MGKKTAASGDEHPSALSAKEEKEEEKKVEKEKKDKPKKAIESAGISPAERAELEKLKNDIIARKKELKDSGMSGGQINKDEEIENPGCLAAAKDEQKGSKKKALSADQEKEKKE